MFWKEPERTRGWNKKYLGIFFEIHFQDQTQSRTARIFPVLVIKLIFNNMSYLITVSRDFPAIAVVHEHGHI